MKTEEPKGVFKVRSQQAVKHGEKGREQGLTEFFGGKNHGGHRQNRISGL